MPTPRLVVSNDDPAYLDMITEVLEDAGYRHVHCTAGKGAFAVIRRERPDAVLLDINAANPDVGWNTLHLMRLHGETLRVPVLVCTTDPHLVREKGEMLRAQRCEVLEKPFDLDTLLAALGAMLELA